MSFTLDRKTQKMFENEIVIIAGLTTVAGILWVAYLLNKAGKILQLQEERDTQLNYEWDSDEP
jgi:hypothetical protein